MRTAGTPWPPALPVELKITLRGVLVGISEWNRRTRQWRPVGTGSKPWSRARSESVSGWYQMPTVREFARSVRALVPDLPGFPRGNRRSELRIASRADGVVDAIAATTTVVELLTRGPRRWRGLSSAHSATQSRQVAELTCPPLLVGVTGDRVARAHGSMAWARASRRSITLSNAAFTLVHTDPRRLAAVILA